MNRDRIGRVRAMADNLRNFSPPVWVSLGTGVLITVVASIIVTGMKGARDVDTRTSAHDIQITDLVRRIGDLEAGLKAIKIHPLELRVTVGEARLTELDRRIFKLESDMRELGSRKSDPADWFHDYVRSIERNVDRLRDQIGMPESRVKASGGNHSTGP